MEKLHLKQPGKTRMFMRQLTTLLKVAIHQNVHILRSNHKSICFRMARCIGVYAAVELLRRQVAIAADGELSTDVGRHCLASQDTFVNLHNENYNTNYATISS